MNTTFLGFAGVLQGMIRSLPAFQAAAMERAAVVVQTEAQRVLGTYDYGWPQLAPSTLSRKSANTPGLETGEMRDSVEHVSDHHEAHIGSNNDKALWFELGTSRGQPPRSFLGEALRHKTPEVLQILSQAVAGSLHTGAIPGSTGVLPVPYSQKII